MKLILKRKKKSNNNHKDDYINKNYKNNSNNNTDLFELQSVSVELFTDDNCILNFFVNFVTLSQ